MSAFFNAKNLSFRYEPFPIGQMAPMVDATLYREVLLTVPIWTGFDQWIRGPEIVREVMETLQEFHIDLGYRPGVSWAKQTPKNIKAVLRG